eukprot:170143-Pyramimonas_sp.AAC.1
MDAPAAPRTSGALGAPGGSQRLCFLMRCGVCILPPNICYWGEGWPTCERFSMLVIFTPCL